MNKPIAWCLKAHSDGSYGEPVVFVGYSMFTENLEKAKKHPWIIYGAGELVPLYAAPVAQEPAPCKGKNCGSQDYRFHSADCFAEHEATVNPGGKYTVKELIAEGCTPADDDEPAAQDMVMVPIEPTKAMVSAAFRQHVFDPPVGPINNHLRVISGIYKSMLYAAPGAKSASKEKA